MIEYIPLLFCIFAMCFIPHKYNVPNLCRKIFIGLYKWFLERRIKEQQKLLLEECYHNVYINEDENGAYIILKNEMIYLKVMKAKPLCGFLAGNTFYTTKESEKYVEFTPKGSF
jgi:hypothetical protein